MDKAAQIELLKKEHQVAVDNFDFDRAESISIQIKKLQTAQNRPQTRNTQLDEETEKLKTSANIAKTKTTQDRVELQRKFHERFQELTKQHTEELNNLSLSYALARERELKRPVHEASVKYEQSKKFGTDHNYQMARSLYQEAVQLEEEVREKRTRQIEEQYRRQKSKLEARQKRETDLLAEKQRAALEELELKASKEQSRLDRVQKAAELKSTLRYRDIPHVSGTMTPRKRSSSVSSSRAPSSARRSSTSSSRLSSRSPI
ncbi:hypothetical protein TVAG_027160 [Trichomonas vaginalis G3]|uniref:Uncharacterized protein n=1 Tax=Trichomonas vaginalis (strain ATCC PRA-98 / G3) TaxID=412133 RepID=A2F1G1_TRIV3|nr:hypothetical protein TVAGG3_0947770 [Trichomonas vaginalis G3]EAY01248.1 hypothetical protein TVAG_027160 [Trichomonas vaginalis G3]KAI5486989.1 hypothetical protein TVAGG3_0947770 [Trichomonas vaginalis G3]|eukprot:XP_001314063.1 hypothetical protein [Trichomonas vaginalis G3]